METQMPEEYNIRTENDIKKLKLTAEHGLDLERSFVESDLPPEVEGQFLDYIKQWEDQYAQRKMTTVGERLGNPTFTRVSDLSAEEVKPALKNAITLLNEQNVKLDTLCEVDDVELYRFITEELLQVEMNDIRIPGMVHGFIYEEFHPNHPYDIKNRCTEILEYIFSDIIKPEELIPWGIPDHLVFNNQSCSKQEFGARINSFRSLYSKIELHNIDYNSVVLNDNEEEALVVATVVAFGVNRNNVTVNFNEAIKFSLVYKYDWWEVCELEIPEDWSKAS
jgi:hypothetical protein